MFCLVSVAEFTDALCPTQWVVADGKLALKGEIEAASKAEKLEWKPQEETVDAFGNIVKIKVSLHMFSLYLDTVSSAHTCCLLLSNDQMFSTLLVHLLMHLVCCQCTFDCDRLGSVC